jgi:ribosomal protein S4E
MARGPKKHLKRLNAPRKWMLGKLGGIWAPRPSTGPHKLRESLPLSLVLRDKLKFALTRREVIMVVMRRHVEVDRRIRTDINFPTGFMDVITIPKTGDAYRVLYDVKGRFVLHPIDVKKKDEKEKKEEDKERNFKLCRVTKLAVGSKASVGRNPFLTGAKAAIPYVVTHDGRTIRYIDPIVKVNDTVKVDLKSGKVIGHLKFEVGNLAMITRGANTGRVGEITRIEKHPGSYEIIHLRDKKGANFATRVANVFVIGDHSKDGVRAAITLPKGKGIQLSIQEEREKREKAAKE